MAAASFSCTIEQGVARGCVLNQGRLKLLRERARRLTQVLHDSTHCSHCCIGALAVVLVMLLDKSKPPAIAGSTSAGEFLSPSSNLQAGWQLFTAEGRKAVGLVKRIESNHQFPDGTTQDGVLILCTDATENWVPSTEVKKLYVTRP